MGYPLLRQFFVHPILHQPFMQAFKIHSIQLLILIEAREYDFFLAGFGILAGCLRQ